MTLDPMFEINSRHIINRGKTLSVKGDKKLEKIKGKRVSLFWHLHLTLLISCVENIKSFENKIFVNLYTHTYPVVKRNGLEDRGKQGKKRILSC